MRSAHVILLAVAGCCFTTTVSADVRVEGYRPSDGTSRSRQFTSRSARSRARLAAWRARIAGYTRNPRNGYRKPPVVSSSPVVEANLPVADSVPASNETLTAEVIEPAKLPPRRVYDPVRVRRPSKVHNKWISRADWEAQQDKKRQWAIQFERDRRRNSGSSNRLRSMELQARRR